MAVKIRMMRLGRRHRPFFRINAMESRNPRNGRILEKLGHYDPIEKDEAKQLVLNEERVKYWLERDSLIGMLGQVDYQHTDEGKPRSGRFSVNLKFIELKDYWKMGDIK